MMIRKFVWIAAAAGTIASVSYALAAQSAPTAQRASFTSAQAAQGRNVFYLRCAECHGADLQGVNAPALAGSERGNLDSQSPIAVESFIDAAMPIGNVGILSPDDLVNVTAFLMQQNGRSPGGAPLTLAAIKRDTAALSGGH